jgi:hypothetical protein
VENLSGEGFEMKSRRPVKIKASRSLMQYTIIDPAATPALTAFINAFLPTVAGLGVEVIDYAAGQTDDPTETDATINIDAGGTGKENLQADQRAVVSYVEDFDTSSQKAVWVACKVTLTGFSPAPTSDWLPLDADAIGTWASDNTPAPIAA